MRHRIFLIPLTLLLGLSSCAVDSGDNGNTDQPIREGTATKLNRAFKNLSKSFTASGTMDYYTSYATSSDSSASETTATYGCLIELGEDSYYYQETDDTTDEILYRENLYEGDNGLLCSRDLNPATNVVLSSKNEYGNKYDEIMVNGFKDLTAKDVKAIRTMADYYQINNSTIAKQIVTTMTGLSTDDSEGLSISQFAFHFDGDNIDRFRILLEHEDSDDDYSYITQYLFTLNLSEYGTTTPRTLEPFEHTANHDRLKTAVKKLSEASNYTIHVKNDYANTSATDVEFDYKIDSSNIYCSKPSHRSYLVKGETEDDDEYQNVNYNRCYKKGTYNGVDNHPYIVDINSDTNEVFYIEEYNHYQSGSYQLQYTFSTFLATFGSIAPEMYKDEGDYFTTYRSTVRIAGNDLSLFSIALLDLLPYVELSGTSTSAAVKMYLNSSDEISKIVITTSGVNYSLGDDNYVTTKLTTTYTFSDLGTTVIPDVLLNADVNK